ncbi:hypothetical protein T12_8870 [Trichinella patagoniensis]|uniref:Uncharacterized protein n=1 Tax=Trichinella patagoniensis TaxID=990121 RepID=A0A0V0YYH2_9BILA|nr:hypothetical protein T12_8870 [Trichinella patagoniensis]
MDTEIDFVIINTGVSGSTLIKQEVKCCWAESSEISESCAYDVADLFDVAFQITFELGYK